ncbi:hypothetical protein B0T20DRAFT_491206 [Sordaria brevicollis]|uniref:Uncharacterized protein n=1 Tax=Sordaria brevicollis TaxID=83679 RepID=A0AAE0NVH2_SORBR|nr:hypothetical protein B0T20DRAFT_491206 [Sordaria brevicollis]
MAPATSDMKCHWRWAMEDLADNYTQAVERNAHSGAEWHEYMEARITDLNIATIPARNRLPPRHEPMPLWRAPKRKHPEPEKDMDANTANNTIIVQPPSTKAANKTSATPDPQLRVETTGSLNLQVESLKDVLVTSPGNVTLGPVREPEFLDTEPEDRVRLHITVPPDSNALVKTNAAAKIMLRFNGTSKVFVKKDANFANVHLHGDTTFSFGGDADKTLLVAQANAFYHFATDASLVIEVVTGSEDQENEEVTSMHPDETREEEEVVAPPNKKQKMSPPEDIASPVMTPEERYARKEREILFLRHKLQKGLLQRDQKPDPEYMKIMSEFMTKLEGFQDLEASIINITKIHKVMKAILKL